MPLLIAIDGPAASGKGTLSRRLAVTYDLPHLDTGLTYRAVGHAMLQLGQDLDDEQAAIATAQTVDLTHLDPAVLARHHIGEAASRIAVIPQVREALVAAQRAFAADPRGAVLDGRDIGTVVCPNATVKLYVTASPKERARRRWNEMQLRGNDLPFATVLGDIRARDERDMGREDSPLRPAEDAHLLDTSEMDIEAAFREACAIIDRARPSSKTT
ncbi:(d)CMP kinase [Rhizobiaceae bacterium]|nr:(d)CMP kinase [Rhizobiaceae bacterium]